MSNSRSSPGRSLRYAVLAGLAWLAPPVARRHAQGVDCSALRAALQSSEPEGGGRSQYARAAQRQQYEIQRTQEYAASVGCGNPAFNDFDGGQPQQCGPIEARIQRMQDNLAQLQGRQQDMEQTSSRHAQVLAQYNSYCSQGTDDGTPVVRDLGPDESEGRSPDDLRTVPLDPAEVPADGGILDERPERPRHLGQPICVRTCDGGYFPLGRSASQDQLDNLEQLCKASCPNTEAHLYTMPKDGQLASAVSAGGEPYTSLPAAFKFEKSFDATCTCKPPGQSWVEALAEAEKLLEAHSGDVVVTDKLSAEMSRPGAAPAAKSKDPVADAPKDRRRKARTGANPRPDDTADRTAAAEGLRGSQVPTASDASADIGPDPDRPTPVVKEGVGPQRKVKGPGGVSRTVRVIDP